MPQKGDAPFPLASIPLKVPRMDLQKKLRKQKKRALFGRVSANSTFFCQKVSEAFERTSRCADAQNGGSVVVVSSGWRIAPWFEGELCRCGTDTTEKGTKKEYNFMRRGSRASGKFGNSSRIKKA